MKDRKKTANVSELKASLSRYLAHVKAGEEVVVTERGKPVAKLIPLTPSEDDEWQRMLRLQRQGLVTLGSGEVPDEFWETPIPDDPTGLVLRALLEERETGR